ncbi:MULTISPECIES: arylamine N-acetyltransferase family protein [Paenibacillus]|uniref:arylamine N-acetyltransferase family protein n=1 Tax=Paenibacillus TaxID=44249 RepID=UPI0022B89810|nr:arylamine N-acetyltransferase [Paenibacillus caseinilyticus]MCZ8520274.1 arylamine N-acetyltransferase [Paenibacillus caseinilyticus]
MSELSALFRRRLDLPVNGTIHFEDLNQVLSRMAKTIPFENLCIIGGTTSAITKEHLVDKILVRREGGLCYEINPLLYLFLLDNGFDVVLTRGIVYSHQLQAYPASGRTHITILLTHKEQTYIVDSGFGGNLPLLPVPLSGETVSSSNGEFRIRRENSEHGDHVLQMKLKHKDTEWKTGYAFYSHTPLTGLLECNDVQTIIAEHPDSPFNKDPLITRLTDRGNITLTHTSFTQWQDGIVTKENVTPARYKELLKRYFGR